MKGTEKQIKWALDIREQFLQSKLGNPEVREERKTWINRPGLLDFLNKIEAVDDASWWIDNRKWLSVLTLIQLSNRAKRGSLVFPTVEETEEQAAEEKAEQAEQTEETEEKAEEKAAEEQTEETVEEVKEEEPAPQAKEAWITAYLNKKGKNLEALATSLGRATKKVIIERAAEIGVDLCTIYTKNEMVSLILTRLEDSGYRLEGTAPAKKEAKTQTRTYEDPYFRSEAAELIFYLVELDGEARAKMLHITKALYRYPDQARKWRDRILKIIHPDACYHPKAAEAVSRLNEIYTRMEACA